MVNKSLSCMIFDLIFFINTNIQNITRITLSIEFSVISKQKNDHEKRIRSLEKKYWTSVAVFITGIGTFIEGLFLVI